MPITELLERNAKEYANDICLVEINPEVKEVRRVTWKEYELMEPNPTTHYRREITWHVMNEKANRFANLLLSRGIKKGDKVVLLDDLIATGGTMKAAAELVEELGGEVVEALFLIELSDLNGRDVLSDYKVDSVVQFEGA